MVEAQQLPLTPAQIAALLQPELICLELGTREKIPALRELAALLKGHPALTKHEAFFREILARERASNTGLGHGLAMPHARTELCRDIVIAVGRSASGIDYGAPDGEPVQLLFLIGTPQQGAKLYHCLVVGLARLLARASNCQRLLAAPDIPAFIRAVAGLRV